MPAESEQPAARDPATAADEDTGQGSVREQFGPLELLRTHKADGRALLLFSRAGDERP